MKIVTHIVAGLFGLIFLAGGLFFFFGTMPPGPPENSLPGKFMAAFAPTGYMAFVKVCEIIGGVLVIVPKTRNLGLLILGPIVINILCFHGFVMQGEGFSVVHGFITAAALFLLWSKRLAFAGLLGDTTHMQTFHCPRCQTKLFVEQINSGAQVKCTSCGEIIPAPSGDASVSTDIPQSAPATTMKHATLIAKLVATYIVLIIVGGFIFADTPSRIRGYAGGNTLGKRLLCNSLGMRETTADAFDPSNPALVTGVIFITAAGFLVFRAYGRKDDATLKP